MRFPIALVLALALALVAALATGASAEVCNLRIVTDASPDYTDMPSMVRSITSKWQTPAEKCWAMFYWNHIARRQTCPMYLHGMELTDPIRQFNDYGFTMCSTISGMNQSIWEFMGLKHKFWDIGAHTVAEVEYDGAWHMYDNSLSAIYTTCDGKRIASVTEIGDELGCQASGGRKEKGHIAKYHCLTGTSANGYLIGADNERSLASEGEGCFSHDALKLRTYYYNWDHGHRYILNLRENEVYTRIYHRLDHYKEGQPSDPAFFVPNTGENGDGSFDPAGPNVNYWIRGNGIWTFKPVLTATEVGKYVHSQKGLVAAMPAGLRPAKAGAPGEAVFRIQSANVTTSQKIHAVFALGEGSKAALSVSTNNGMTWNDLWKSEAAGESIADLKLIKEVSGAYQPMIKVELTAGKTPTDAMLTSIAFETTTMINTKAQPKLLLGKNTVFVGAGDQTESIVVWPDLQAGRYKDSVVEAKNMVSDAHHLSYLPVLYPEKPGDEGWVVYRLDAPGDLTQVTYGGRFYNRAPGHADLLHSFDGGKTWTRSWTLEGGEDKQPWDVLHYETVAVPAGTRSVLLKYSCHSPGATEHHGIGLYALRIEGDYKPADTVFKPIEVTYAWSEKQKGAWVERSHTQLIEKIPTTYVIDVGGEDLPRVDSLRVNLRGAVQDAKYGYSDGIDAGGEKWIYRWVTYGRNLAEGKKYTVSRPSTEMWGACDPDLKKLTDGRVGASFSGGLLPADGALWQDGQTVEIVVDLEKPESMAAFRIHLFAGDPWNDIFSGFPDKVEMLVSMDGKEYASLGQIPMVMRYKDVPINHMLPETDHATGWNCTLALERPVVARWLKYKLTAGRSVVVSEVQALDKISYDPFDLQIALPDAK